MTPLSIGHRGTPNTALADLRMRGSTTPGTGEELARLAPPRAQLSAAPSSSLVGVASFTEARTGRQQ